MRKLQMIVIVIVLFVSTTACSIATDQSSQNSEDAATHQSSQNSEDAATDQSSQNSEDAATEEAEYGSPSSKDSANQAMSSEPMPSQEWRIEPPRSNEADDMFFKNYGTNPFIATEDDHLSTFAVDVDTGAYTVVRNYVSRGLMPPQEAVRVEEFVNYFRVNDESPEDQTFAIHVEGGASPFGKGYQLLRIGLKGKEIAPKERKPANLIFVIDVSGSMRQENRMELVKRSLKLLVDQLEEQDQVGIVIYGTQAEKVLQPSSIEDKERILEAIDQLSTQGSTNVEEGLQLGYEMAQEYYDEEATNRIILCSDGVANVGETEADDILDNVEKHKEDGIYLSTFGFGMGNYNDVLMEQLADKGDGMYSYIDSFTEARKVFLENLAGTLETIAKDVKVQVEFDPERIDRYRLLGYENRDVEDEDYRNDDADAGEIGSGHSVTALYEVKIKGDDPNDLGKVSLRYYDTGREKTIEVSKSIQVQPKLSRELTFLASVAEFAEIARDSYWAKGSSMEKVLTLAEQSADGEEQLNFVTMVKDYMAIPQDDE